MATVTLRLAVAYDRRERVRFHWYRARTQLKIAHRQYLRWIAANPVPAAGVRPTSHEARVAYETGRISVARTVIAREYTSSYVGSVDRADHTPAVEWAIGEIRAARAALAELSAARTRVLTANRVRAHRARKRNASRDRRVALAHALTPETPERRAARIRAEADELRAIAVKAAGGGGTEYRDLSPAANWGPRRPVKTDPEEE